MLRQVAASDLDCCFDIESVAYDGDEAASREKIERRILSYPQGFFVYEKDGIVVGFVNSGASNDISMSDDEFKELIGHDPNGRCAVILSLAVHPDYQRQGIAAELMYYFVEKMQQQNKTEVHLMCQPELMEYYRRFGFQYVKDSSSQHGGLSWKEMKRVLL